MKYEHEVIRDLMPLCIDGIASPQSQKTVEEHIAECPDCAKEWEIMKNGIQTYESSPLPEDTPKYAETAKRVRKHKRWLLLRIACCFVVLLFAALLVMNYMDGARFTARGAAEAMLRDHGIMDIYETPEAYQNAPKHKLTYLGEVTAKEGDTKIVYELIESADASLTGFVEVGVSREPNVLRLGMWKEDGGTSGSIDTEDDRDTIIMDQSGFSPNMATASFGALMIYSIDSRVTSVNIEGVSQNIAVEIAENGFGAVVIDERLEYQSGSALDADGNVLYTLEPVMEEWGLCFYWTRVE